MDEYIPDEVALRKQSRRGQEAKRILESEVYREAWDSYRQALFDAFERVPAEKQETLARLKAAVDVTNQVRSHLETIMADGAMADEQVKALEIERKQKRRWFGT